MHNKFEEDKWKTFPSYRANKVKLLTQNVKNHNKSAILNFLSAIIELVRELFISNIHNKFEEDTPQGQIIDRKGEKTQ